MGNDGSLGQALRADSRRRLWPNGRRGCGKGLEAGMPSLSQAQTATIRHIYQQIRNILYDNRFGIIEEVHIDLRNKDFDSDDFDIPKALFKARELSSNGPRLVFPWTELSESFCPPKDYNDLGSRPGNDVELRDVIIEKGDRIYISRVELLDSEIRLRGCNIERRHVYFSIKKKGEDAVEINQPLLLKPKNEIFERDFIGNYYSAIREESRPILK